MVIALKVKVCKLQHHASLLALHWITLTLKSLYEEYSAVADRNMLEQDVIHSVTQGAIVPEGHSWTGLKLNTTTVA